MNDIKQCPFCGIAPHKRDEEEDFDDIPDSLIEVTCQCIQSEFSYAEIDLDVWNRRPIEDAQTARIAALEAQLGDSVPYLRNENAGLREIIANNGVSIDKQHDEIKRLEAQLAEAQNLLAINTAGWQKATRRTLELEAQLAAVPKWVRITDDELAELQDGTPVWIVYEGFYVSHSQAQIEEEGATDVEWGEFVGHFKPITPPEAAP